MEEVRLEELRAVRNDIQRQVGDAHKFVLDCDYEISKLLVGQGSFQEAAGQLSHILSVSPDEDGTLHMELRSLLMKTAGDGAEKARPLLETALSKGKACVPIKRH